MRLKEVILAFVASYLFFGSTAFGETSSKIRITGVVADDDGERESSIDVVQESCGTGDAITPEPFHDSYLIVTVKNESSFVLTVTGAKLTVRDADGANTRYRSSWLAPTGQIEIAKGESQELTIPFLKAGDGSKSFVGKSTAIPETLGFRAVDVQLRARIANGRKFTARAKASFGFGNEDRC